MRVKNIAILLVLGILLSSPADIFAKKKNKAEKAAKKLAKMEKSLTKILGTDSNWKADAFKNLQYEMPCSEVKQYFSSLRCNYNKMHDFPKVAGPLMGKISEYKFYFKEGKLQNATIIFGPRLFDSKRFRTALLNVAQKKWGILPPEKLQRTIITWTNSDFDSVTLSYVGNSHWEIKNSMPKFDCGDVNASSLNENSIRSNLEQFLGTNQTWTAAGLSSLKGGMSYQQVLKMYPSLKGFDPSKSYSFPRTVILNEPLVPGLKFTFKEGKLKNVHILFHRQLNKEVFKKVSLELFEKKWGSLKPEMRDKDILTKYKSKLGTIQRNYMVDHWEIKIDLPVS